MGSVEKIFSFIKQQSMAEKKNISKLNLTSDSVMDSVDKSAELPQAIDFGDLVSVITPDLYMYLVSVLRWLCILICIWFL